jgi:hypothetical protein
MTTWTGAGSLAPGDVVYFDRADTWTVAGGPQGFYLAPGVTYIGDRWGAGTRARIRAGSGFEAGLVRFRDHPSVPTVFQGFDVDAANQVANGVDINTGYWQLMNGATKRVQNCVVHHVWSDERRHEYRYGIIVSNHGGTGGYAENVEILDNVVHDVARDAIGLYPGDESRDNRIRNLLVRGNEVWGTGRDPAYCCGAGVLIKGYVVDAVVEYNRVHDVKGASIFVNGNEYRQYGTGPSNVHIRHNIVTNATQHGAILVYDGGGGNDPKDLQIYGNVVYNSTAAAGLRFHRRLGGSLTVRVFDNVFHNAPVRIENSRAHFRVLEFRDNVVSYAGGVPFIDAGGKVTAHANNVFHRGSGTLVRSGGLSYNAASLRRYEATASSRGPLFRNVLALPLVH